MPQTYDVVAFSSMTTRAGSAVRIRSLCRHLARLGCRVLLTERAYPGDAPLEEPNLTHRLQRTEDRPLALALAANLRENLRVAASVRARVALALKPLPNAALPALLLGRRGALTAVDVDDLDPEYYGRASAKAASWALFRWFPRRFDRVTTHNRFLREVLEGRCQVAASRLFLLPQGIEWQRFAPRAADEELRSRLGLVGRDVVAYTASLGMTSDLDRVLPALAEFARRGEGRAVLVLGDGVRLGELRRAAVRLPGGERIAFAGRVEHDEVPRHLALCRVGFNYMEETPANRCRASLKVREYLAAGLRVVCNPVGELVDLERYFVSFRSVDEVPAALERALAEEGADAAEARVWASTACDWPTIASDFLAQLGIGPAAESRP